MRFLIMQPQLFGIYSISRALDFKFIYVLLDYISGNFKARHALLSDYKLKHLNCFIYFET